jgi:PAS domain S-box-containing protein
MKPGLYPAPESVRPVLPVVAYASAALGLAALLGGLLLAAYLAGGGHPSAGVPRWVAAATALNMALALCAVGLAALLALRAWRTGRHMGVGPGPSESWHAQWVASSPQPIVILNGHALLLANPALVESFGYGSAAEILALGSFDALVAPEDRERLRGYAQAPLSGGPAPTHYEFQGLRRDGTRIWLEGHARVIDWEGGLVTQRVFHDITARKRLEEQVRAERALLRGMLDAIPHHIVVKDTAGRYLTTNRAFAESLHTSPEALVGRSIAQLPYTKQETIRLLEEQDRLVLSTGKTVDWQELRMDWQEAETVRNLSKIPLKDEQGNVTGIVVLSEDVTERVRLDEDLKASRRILQTVVDTVPHALFVKDRDGRMLMVNQALARIHGLRPRELVGRVVPDLPSTPEDWGAQDRRVFETGEPLRIGELRVAEADGGTAIRSHVKYPLRDASGAVVGVVGISEDITERKRAEAELARMAAALEQAGDSIFITNAQGEILYANLAFERISGYSRQEALGQTPRFLRSGLYDRDFYRGLWETLRRGEVWKARYKNRHQDGHLYEIEATQSPIRDAQGQVTHFVSVQKDVTQQARLEEQLRRSQRMEAIGTLAGGIAHDFNNILTPILGFGELMLADTPEGSPHRAYLRTILDAAMRAKGMVSQILLFGRRTETPMAPVRLPPIVDDALALLRSTLPSSVRIREQVDADLAVVNADTTQIYQVLMNLCVNAVQAMDQGGTLVVSACNVELREHKTFLGQVLSGAHVRLTVADTGTGMNGEVLAHIFEPFFTTKPVGKGTGLGLSTVFGIVKQHGGSIDVASTPGQGTTFDVYLPAVTDRPAPAQEPAAPLVGGSESILVVDDEPAIVELLRKVLGQLGYRVHTCVDSVAALDLFRDRPEAFDLVISDQTMPDLSGDRLLAELRRIRPELPVILCSGFSETVSAEQARALGADDFLLKPTDRGDLARAVRRALDRVRAGEASGQGATVGQA